MGQRAGHGTHHRRIGLLAITIAVVLTSACAVDAAGFVGVRAAVQATETIAPQPIVTFGVARVEGDSSTTSLSFDVSGLVAARAFVMTAPDRVVIDLPQADFAASAKAVHPGHGRKTLVSAFRFGLLAAGRSRIVVDLAGPARIDSAQVKVVGGHSRFVLALARTDRAAFIAATASSKAPAVVEPAVSVAAANERPTIVIDAGHGGPDNGAVVGGAVEKDVTLAFARQLAGKLEASGRLNVVLSRSSDVFVPLAERVRIARASGAALMISVHADTLPESADVGGATVYTVSDKASDAYAAKVAAKENEADVTVGVDGQADVADVNDILFDLTRQETRAYSHVFARTLVNYWKVAGRLNKNPQRAAGFVVLKAPDVPSVLLELGYLSNAQDAAQLTSDTWREAATGRMAEAVLAYFADKQGPAKAAAGVPIPAPQALAALSAR